MTKKISALVAGLVLLLCGCTTGGGGGGPLGPAGGEEAKQVAVDWMTAYDAGDGPRACDLTIRGQGDGQARCLEMAPPASNTFVGQPKALKVEEWTTPTGEKGLGVLVEFRLNTAPDPDKPQYNVVGLFDVDGRWLVDRGVSVEGDPNAEGAIQLSLNKGLS